MPKIDINQTAEVIKRHDIEPEKLRAIVEELNLIAQPEPDEEKAPAVKKQFSVVISDPTGLLSSDTHKHLADSLTGWVLQIPEDASVTSTLDRVHKAAYEFNTTKKGRMMPAKTVGDALENIPAKHFKEQQVWVKTKVPVFVMTTDNEIPREPAQADAHTEAPAISLPPAAFLSNQDAAEFCAKFPEPAQAASIDRTTVAEWQATPEHIAEATKIAQAEGHVSVSMIQRRLRVSYNHGCNILEKLVADGVVAAQPSDPSLPHRYVLNTPAQADASASAETATA